MRVLEWLRFEREGRQVDVGDVRDIGDGVLVLTKFTNYPRQKTFYRRYQCPLGIPAAAVVYALQRGIEWIYIGLGDGTALQASMADMLKHGVIEVSESGMWEARQYLPIQYWKPLSGLLRLHTLTMARKHSPDVKEVDITTYEDAVVAA